MSNVQCGIGCFAPFRLVLVLCCAVFVSVSAIGSELVQRLGPITIVEVQVPDVRALQDLVNAGYDIGSVRGQTATVYATQEELRRLSDAGFAWKEVPPPLTRKGLGGYHTYDSLTADLHAFASAHPDVCRVSSIGKSAQDRDLWAVLVTKHPDVEEDEPEFKYVSTIHGDEPVGTELCVAFIRLLLDGYGTDPRVTALVDTTAIRIVPLMNPDGFELNQRYNADGFDLNRSFPNYPATFSGTLFDGAPLDTDGRPPEVVAVMQWTAAHRFVASANFHTGALLVNYPYDYDNKPSGVNAPTPDDALFQDISRRYSAANLPMWDNPQFIDGVSNGSAWYTVLGGMQDWNYRYAGCNEVTIEISEDKAPSASDLAGLWDDNKESMLRYLEAVHLGVRGRVTDHATGAPLSAEIRVDGNSQPVFTDPVIGDYHRMLLPGAYALTFAAHGYAPRTVANVIVGDGTAGRVDRALTNGDVDGSGIKDARDVQLVINAVLGRAVPYDCDVDGGDVTATDVQVVVNCALGVYDPGKGSRKSGDRRQNLVGRGIVFPTRCVTDAP